MLNKLQVRLSSKAGHMRFRCSQKHKTNLKAQSDCFVWFRGSSFLLSSIHETTRTFDSVRAIL